MIVVVDDLDANWAVCIHFDQETKHNDAKKSMSGWIQINKSAEEEKQREKEREKEKIWSSLVD